MADRAWPADEGASAAETPSLAFPEAPILADVFSDVKTTAQNANQSDPLPLSWPPGVRSLRLANGPGLAEDPLQIPRGRRGGGPGELRAVASELDSLVEHQAALFWPDSSVMHTSINHHDQLG